MNQSSPQEKQASKWIRIVARIWSAPIILFVLIFTVSSIWSWLTNGPADPYAVEDPSLLESLPPIFIGFSALGLALAWRWEKFGGIFSLVSTGAAVLTLLLQGLTSTDFSRSLIPYLLALIVLIPGIFFVIQGTRSNEN